MLLFLGVDDLSREPPAVESFSGIVFLTNGELQIEGDLGEDFQKLHLSMPDGFFSFDDWAGGVGEAFAHIRFVQRVWSGDSQSISHNTTVHGFQVLRSVEGHVHGEVGLLGQRAWFLRAAFQLKVDW